VKSVEKMVENLDFGKFPDSGTKTHPKNTKKTPYLCKLPAVQLISIEQPT